MEARAKCNRLLSLFLVFVSLFVAAVSHASSVQLTGIGPACTDGTITQKVSFVHVGDLHANFDLVEDKYSRIRAYMEKVRQGNPYTIFTNAGDDHEKGSVAEQYSRGSAVMDATFAMQFDVRTIGNHDFAWGVEHLLAFTRDPHGLVLSSNTYYDGPDALGLGSVDYGVLQVGCLRIGFFGLVGGPWNELDQELTADYFPSLHTTFNFAEIAGKIVAAHRGEVDLMVMVSHLGILEDENIAAKVSGIDLVLGGHSHLVPMQEKINNTLVVLPDFYSDGVTRVDFNVDVATKSISSYNYVEQPVAALTDIDSTVHQAISDILATYAPDTQQPIAYLEHSFDQMQDTKGMPVIAAKAGINQYGADAALLDPAMADPWGSWSSGEVTSQDMIDGYYVERQAPNTPGVNALYMAEVSGAGLKLMKGQQSGWVYSGTATPVDTTMYKVILHKGAALNPSLFFPGVAFISVTYLSETWETLAAYGASRTIACLSLDTDSQPPIPSCTTPGSYSVWNFSDSGNRFKTTGSATNGVTLDYWGSTVAGKTVFNSSAGFSLPSLPDGPAPGVMKFPKTASSEGYLLTHNTPPNGAYSSNGLVSNYTVVMDLLWPTASINLYRALLQTSATNADDADWFVGNNNDIGISSYFGSLNANQWYRIALVARAAPTDGTLQFFVDGQFVGEVSNADVRWALGPTALLFADNNDETQQGYLAGALFAGYAMTKAEVLGLGKASIDLPPVINGTCGSANGGTFNFPPTANLCSTGTASAMPTGNVPWTWICNGSNGGTSSPTCSAKSTQSITITTPAPATAVIGSQFSVAATVKSGQTVTYSSGSTGICTNNNATFTMIATSGICVVQYNQTGNANYTAAPQLTSNTTATKITPVITWSNPADITYGTALSTTTHLNATSGGVAGTFIYTPASGAILNAGNTQTLSVTFTPTDTANYSTPAAKTVTINVIPAPILGVCGTSNNQSFTIVPTINLCLSGTATTITGTGPWSWTCDGANGGSTASCFATKSAPTKPGDCDANGTVTIAEVQSAINMFLGLKAVESCVDIDRSNSVSIAEVQKVINSFLGL